MSDRIQGNAGDENRQVAQGKDIQQVSVYADSITWREAVREGNYQLRADIAELRSWVRGLLITIFVLFVMGAVLSALAIRQFDLTNNWIQYNVRRIDAIERRIDRVLSDPLP